MQKYTLDGLLTRTMLGDEQLYLASEADAEIDALKHDMERCMENSTWQATRIAELEKSARELYAKWHSDAGISRHPMWMRAAAELKEKFVL